MDLQFDERGNVAAQTAPYYADETAKITTFEYDKFTRQVKTAYSGEEGHRFRMKEATHSG